MEPFSVVSTTVKILSLFSNNTGSVELNRLKIRPSPSRFPMLATWLLMARATRGSSDSVTVRMPSGRLRCKRVSSVIELTDHALRRDARDLRRTFRRIEAEVDDRDAAARLEITAQLAQVALAVLDVVKHIDHQDQVGLFGQARIVGRADDRDDVLPFLALRALG